VAAVAFTIAAIPVAVATAAAITAWRAARWSVGLGPQPVEPPAERTRPRDRPGRRWPSPRPLTRTARRAIDSLASIRDLPPPVGVYAGRYQGAIVWREDVETFAACLVRTTSEGELRTVWHGEHPGQFPTVESLAEALDAYGLGLDPVSYDLARSYQQAVWDRVGSCAIAATRRDDGSHHLTIHTPSGHTQDLAPATERDDRSAAFGPPTDLAWGSTSPGALETARCLLEYTGSTTRTPQQLFDDARSLTLTNIRRWPQNLTVNVADLHNWAGTRHQVPHQAIDPAVHLAQTATRPDPERPTRRRPNPPPRSGQASPEQPRPRPPDPPERFRLHPEQPAATSRPPDPPERSRQRPNQPSRPPDPPERSRRRPPPSHAIA
jgi:hypothetical protein